MKSVPTHKLLRGIIFSRFRICKRSHSRQESPTHA